MNSKMIQPPIKLNYNIELTASYFVVDGASTLFLFSFNIRQITQMETFNNLLGF